MTEFDLNTGTKAPVEIKIAGIGGAGSNVLDRLILDGIENADLIVLNTDAQALTSSVAPTKIQLGRDSARGLGAGGDPEVGFLAAQEASEEIAKAFDGAGMVFLLAGLGGGTGSGAAPLVAQIAREQGALVIVFATVPFPFEGKRRKQQAEEALQSLHEHADVVICFENEKMADSVSPKAGIHQAFQSADQTVSQSIRAICNLFNRPGLIKIGFDELCTVVRGQSSSCLFGYGEAEGDNRANDCLARALKNPLMDRGRMLEEAQSVLVNVAGSTNMTLNEVNILMTELNRHVGDHTHILFGTAIDPKMGNRMSVTLVSAIGAAQPQWVRPRTEVAPAARPIPAVPEPPARMEPRPPIARTEPRPLFERPAAVVSAPEPAPVVPTPASELFTPPEAQPLFPTQEEAEHQEPETEDLALATPAEPGPLFSESVQAIPFPPEPVQEPIARNIPTPQSAEELQPAASLPSQFDFVEASTPAPAPSNLPPEPAPQVPEMPAAPIIRRGTPPLRQRQPVSAQPGELGLNIPPNPATPKSAEVKQETLQFEPVTRGRFEKSEPTIEDGQDLDVPTFLRRNIRIK
jgi:cell division protein FtsZ